MIQVENLTYIYEDGTCALNDVSLQLNHQITGLLGANGSGKSTMFLNILGVYKPKHGQIILDGKPLKYGKKDLLDYRQYVNLVMQNPDQQIFFNRVYDEVAFALRNMGLSEDEVDRRVVKSLASVGLSDLGEKPVHLLSYGQKKRVAFASVLAMNTKVLLLDEPTAGLDPKMKNEMKDLIYQLKDQGKHLLISSHDMDFMYEVCDYYYVLSRGKNVTEGVKKEVFTDRELIESIGLEQPTLVRLSQQGNLPIFDTEDALIGYLLNNRL